MSTSSPRPPYQLRRPTWVVPGLCLLLVGWLGLGVHSLLNPATDRLHLDYSPLQDPIEVARFGAGARAWALSYLATVAASLGVIAFGVTTLLRLAYAADSHQRRHRTAAQVLIVLVVATMGMVAFEERYVLAVPPYWQWLQAEGEQRVLRYPLVTVLKVQSVLLAGGAGALFAAATCLIARIEEARLSADPRAALVRHRDQLHVLVLAGAIGTSLAVLHFSTSHGLATAGLVAADEEARVAQVAAVDRMVAFEALYWGGMYTIGLISLYLVPASLIAGSLQRVASESPKDADEPATLQSWMEVLKPALGAITVAAPLVTGALSGLLSHAGAH